MNTIIFFLITIFASLTPATEATVSQPVEASVVCEEDMECWNPETMGNGLGTLSSPAEQDAWAQFDKTIGTLDLSSDFRIEYVETVPMDDAQVPKAAQFIVTSSDGEWHHVFQITQHWNA